MTYRKTPIVQDEIYHVFNRSVGRQLIFLSTKDYRRALEVFRFYLYNKPSLRFSFYNRLPYDQKSNFFNEMIKSAFPKNFKAVRIESDEPTYIFKDPVLGQFKSIEDYKKFVLDQVDYQRKLNEIKHLVLE